MISDWSLRESDSFLRDMSTDSDVLASHSRAPGRLAFSTSSGAGKMRIFAICNYVIQRLLRPVHDFLMKVWRTLPTDGTFNQIKPFSRLVGEMNAYSFDLKSATDRAWLGLQSALIAQLFENSLSAFVCSAFRSYPFRAPFLKKIPQVKSNTLRIGQPLFGLLLLLASLHSYSPFIGDVLCRASAPWTEVL